MGLGIRTKREARIRPAVVAGPMLHRLRAAAEHGAGASCRYGPEAAPRVMAEAYAGNKGGYRDGSRDGGWNVENL